MKKTIMRIFLGAAVILVAIGTAYGDDDGWITIQIPPNKTLTIRLKKEKTCDGTSLTGTWERSSGGERRVHGLFY